MVNPSLVTECLAFKSKNGKFVRLQKNEEGCRKVLQLSDEEQGGTVLSPYARFFAEPSKKHQGYVHIRCCYNNKYWVARQMNGGECCVLGDANEPEEDLSKPSCTLFRKALLQHYSQSSDGDNLDEDDCELQHIGLNKSVYMVADDSLVPSRRHSLNGCLLLGNADEKPNADDGYIFSAVALNSVELPRHVCFMGDNDLYMRIRIIERLNYLQFSADDIGDPTTRHTIHHRSDGNVRVSSELNGRTWFWRYGRNWIWADHSDTSPADRDTLFRPVMVAASTVALQSLGNNNYCQRLTADNKESCLNAATQGINRWAQLRMEEAVISRRIYNVEYRIHDATIHSPTVLTVSTAAAANRTGSANTAKLTLKYTVATERAWDSSVSLKLGVTTTIQAGFPRIAGGSVQVETERTQSVSWGRSESRTEEHSIDYEFTVPPNTALKITVLATQATYDVPFSYYQEDVLTTGEKVVSRFNDGIFHGANSYDFAYEVTEEKL